MSNMASTGSFPVVFFDGEREIDIGNVNIYPSLEFKQFQSIVSQKIGIAPHQISVSLISRRKGSSSTARKIPITEKINFGAIILQKDSIFFAVLKRSRRERRGKTRQINLEDENYSTPIDIPLKKYSISPPEKMLLRRNPGAHMNDSSQFGLISSYYGQISASLEYENQLRNLQIQRENYLMSTNPYPYTEMEDEYLYGNINDRVMMPRGVIVCEECSAGARGLPVPFHWCVYDTITVGFRSPAGPIARPSKG